VQRCHSDRPLCMLGCSVVHCVMTCGLMHFPKRMDSFRSLVQARLPASEDQKWAGNNSN
jgi:hypothetical protein